MVYASKKKKLFCISGNPFVSNIFDEIYAVIKFLLRGCEYRFSNKHNSRKYQ